MIAMEFKAQIQAFWFYIPTTTMLSINTSSVLMEVSSNLKYDQDTNFCWQILCTKTKRYLFEFFRLPCTRCFQLRTKNSNLLLLLFGFGGQNVDLWWSEWKFSEAVIFGSSVPSQNGRKFALHFTVRSREHNRGISRRPKCTFMLLGNQQRMSLVRTINRNCEWLSSIRLRTDNGNNLYLS